MAIPNKSKDSYWYIGEEKTMKAMCVNCHAARKIGWFWNGSVIGYGNYNLNCAVCGESLHKKGEPENGKNETCL